MAEILEVLMVLSFGASWPFNVMKSYKARTTKGKSLLFLCLIFFGYIVGITSKLVNVVYCLNLIMVGADLIIYFRNKKIDKENESA